MGACPGLGSTVSAHAPLGLLVGSRSSPMRMARGTSSRARLGTQAKGPVVHGSKANATGAPRRS